MSLPSTGRELETSPTLHHKIFRAASVVAICSVLALAGSTARELVVAQWFGRSDALDAFLIAYLLPSFLVSLAAGSFNSAVIPTFIEVRRTEGEEAAQRLFSGVMVGSIALMLAVSILLGALAPVYLPLMASGFSPAKLHLTRQLLYALLPFVVLSGLAVIWGGVLNAEERFAMPALLPILVPACAVAFLLLLGKGWGIFALAAGTMFGAAIQATVLGWLLKSRGIRLRPEWRGLDPALSRVIGQYLPMVAGALLMGTTELVNQSMAAMLEPGSVAALNYGRKVVNLIVAVGALPLSTAALPYFSQMVAERDWAACRRALKTYSRLIAAVTVPVTLALVLLSRPLVRLLFERGAFTALDAKIVSDVQALFLLQVPFYILGNLGVRVVSALKRNAVLMQISAVNVVLNVLLNWVLMKYAGVAGIALSTSVVYMVSCTLVFGSISLALRREDPRG